MKIKDTEQKHVAINLSTKSNWLLRKKLKVLSTNCQLATNDVLPRRYSMVVTCHERIYHYSCLLDLEFPLETRKNMSIIAFSFLKHEVCKQYWARYNST